MKMKMKRKVTPLPSSPSQETTANHVNPLLETRITCSLLTTKTVEPCSSTKKAKFDNVIVRRSQRIQSAVAHQPMISIAHPVIQIIDPIGSEQNELRNPAQSCLDREPQNQHPTEHENRNEDNDFSEDNSIELEPEEPINDKLKGSKNKSDMQYRTMFAESQKKLQKLAHANNELSKKLAVAEGKLEVYEKGSGILSSILDKTKDLFMASALSNASDQAFVHSKPRAISRKKTITASKRKNKPIASLR